MAVRSTVLGMVYMLRHKNGVSQRRVVCYASAMENAALTPEQQQLRMLLEHSSGLARDLPILKAEASDGWGAPLRDWLQQRLTEVWEWFKALVEPLPMTPESVDWTAVFWGLVWTCVALLVFWLTYALAKTLLGRKRPQGARDGRLPDPVRADEQLEQQWRAAVQAEYWGLAARLRWRLFVARRRCQPDMTPREFFAAPPYRQRWEQLQGAPVSEQYQVMFAANHGSPQWLIHYHNGLTSLEGEPRHA
jgi:hypothetical protein